jgi:hypothetical protein
MRVTLELPVTPYLETDEYADPIGGASFGERARYSHQWYRAVRHGALDV